MTAEVVVIDYGMGNLFSVRRGFEHSGAAVTITADPQAIAAAKRLVLPGVGAFGDAMKGLRRLGLVPVLREYAASGRPLLGICLGMQLLFDESEEFGLNEGLGLIPGRVQPLPDKTVNGERQKVPHIGWNGLVPSTGGAWQSTVLRDLAVEDAVYFVHSFAAQPADPAHRLADCIYGGHRISAVVAHGAIAGCQFHPEKSGAIGLSILRAFCAQED